MDDGDRRMCWHEDKDEMECWWCSMMVLVESGIEREGEMSSRERENEDRDATENGGGVIGSMVWSRRENA